MTRADLDIKIDVWRDFLIRYFSNYYTLHRSDLAARAAPLDPRLDDYNYICEKPGYCNTTAAL